MDQGMRIYYILRLTVDHTLHQVLCHVEECISYI